MLPKVFPFHLDLIIFFTLNQYLIIIFTLKLSFFFFPSYTVEANLHKSHQTQTSHLNSTGFETVLKLLFFIITWRIKIFLKKVKSSDIFKGQTTTQTFKKI